jgi:hypothetical protein
MASKMQVLLLSALAASAAAAPMAIVAKGNKSLCLDLLGERTQPGTPIDTWECVAGLLGQQWFFDAGTWRIRSAVAPTKCIDAGDSKSGMKVTLEDCNETSTTQYFGWDITTNAIYATPEKASLKPASMCMEIGGKEHGGRVTLRDCNGTKTTQQWSAVVGPAPMPKKNETFTFSPALSNGKLCLDLKDNKVANGNPIDLAQCNASSKGQEWIFAEGSYRIASALAPNKCVDATDMKNGTRLILWDCNGFPQQQWGYQAAATGNEGTVYLTQAPDSNVCMATDSANANAVVGGCVPWRLTNLKPTIVV